MGLHPDRPWELARAALDAVVAHYGAEGQPLPAPRFVTTGQVVADCELVAVAVQRVFPHEGDVAAEPVQALARHPGHVMRGLIATVTVLRCAPTLDAAGEPPDPDDVEDSARLVLGDAQMTWDALHAAHQAGRLTSCNSLAYLGWDSYGPEGGIAGGFVTVRAGLE